MQTHRFSKPSDIFLPPPPPPCASLSKGFSRKIAAKILWVMAAHKVGCGPFPPRSIYPPLPSKTTPWPGHSSHSAHFLRRIFGDTSNDGGRHSRFLISRIISFPRLLLFLRYRPPFRERKTILWSDGWKMRYSPLLLFPTSIRILTRPWRSDFRDIVIASIKIVSA